MRYLIIGDIHLEDSAIEEVKSIFAELHNQKKVADSVVIMGDFYDKKKLSPSEIEVGTEIIAQLAETYDKVYLVRGNHDIIHDDLSTIDYLRHLGRNTSEGKNIYIANEFVLDNIFFGHFFTDKSTGYGAKEGKPLNPWVIQYEYVILGHQHDFQQIHANAYHIGSIRYTSFGETATIPKRYGVIDTTLKQIFFYEFKSTVPITDVYSVADLKRIPKRFKVRIVFKDFTQFKREVNMLHPYKDRFVEFKIKLDFARADTPEKTLAITQETNKLATIVNEWLTTVTDPDVKKELEEEFHKELC
jgi:DNA repair exonuclease SbcCD nuclease subunit